MYFPVFFWDTVGKNTQIHLVFPFQDLWNSHGPPPGPSKPAAVRFLHRYINSCSLCCSAEADAAWRKQSWEAGGVNNTHLEVCRSVARCDTLKTHLASVRWCPLTSAFPPSTPWGWKHVEGKCKSRTWRIALSPLCRAERTGSEREEISQRCLVLVFQIVVPSRWMAAEQRCCRAEHLSHKPGSLLGRFLFLYSEQFHFSAITLLVGASYPGTILSDVFLQKKKTTVGPLHSSQIFYCKGF